MFDRLHRQLGPTAVALPPHGSSVTSLDGLIGSGPDAMLGSVAIEYQGKPTDLLFSGAIEDDEAGHSAALRLTMPMEMDAHAATSSSCNVASAGLMVGKPDPMEGFPSSVSFSLFGYAHNTSSSAVTLHSYANYMDAAGPHNIAIADQLLQPGETRNLNLATALKLPIRDGSVNLSFSYAAACGSVLIETASVDATGSYVFEVEPVGVGKSWGHTSHYWQIGAGTDTMYTVWNPTQAPEDFIVTLNYEPGGVYSYPLHLEPNASAMISVLDLVMMGKPDAQGRMIPAGTKMGSFSIKNADPDIRKGRVFVVSGGIYNPTAGTCCQNYWTCDGVSGSVVDVQEFTITVGGVTYEYFYVTFNNGGQQNYTSLSTWNSNNGSILETGSNGQVTGTGPGSTTIAVDISDVPLYVPQFCGGNCPYGGTGANAGGTVCTRTISNPINGQVFSMSSGYNTAQLPLNASSNCNGTTVTWTIQCSYQRKDGTVYVSGPLNTTSTLGQTANWTTPAGVGGQANMTASASVTGAVVTAVEIAYVDGTSIPSSSITSQLTSLYLSGSRPALLTGIAQYESNYQQFVSRNLYLVQGLWPNESYDTSGSHVGLMQMPNAMNVAFDWISNTSAGASLFQTKLSAASSNMKGYQSGHPALPNLTGAQLENDALVYYGPYGAGGPYYVPNSSYNGWVVNTANPNGVNYANGVVADIQ